MVFSRNTKDTPSLRHCIWTQNIKYVPEFIYLLLKEVEILKISFTYGY